MNNLENMEGDSDDCPEDIPFTQSKDAIKSQFHQVISAARHEKQKQKLKKTKNHQLMKEQKEKRIQELLSKRLPDEILNEISSQPLKIDKPEDNSNIAVDDKTNSKSKPNRRKITSMKTFVPKDNKSVKFKILTLDEELKLSQKIPSTVKGFRHRKLHAKWIPRESSQKMLLKHKKQIAGGHRKVH